MVAQRSLKFPMVGGTALARTLIAGIQLLLFGALVCSTAAVCAAPSAKVPASALQPAELVEHRRLGRLILTPAQRQARDLAALPVPGPTPSRLSSKQPARAVPTPGSRALSGFVLRSDGHNSYWYQGVDAPP